MTQVDIDILRQIIREEICSCLGVVVTAPASEPEVVERRSADPYDMDDTELEAAERMLPPGNLREALRLRVMAFRLKKKGNVKSAANMRSRAERLERQHREAA